MGVDQGSSKTLQYITVYSMSNQAKPNFIPHFDGPNFYVHMY